MFVVQRRFNLICATLIISWGTFKWIHSIHYIRGQCIPLRNTIHWKTCLWKDKYFFNSKLLEVYLFWWEKENSIIIPTVMCTKLTDKEEKQETEWLKAHIGLYSRSQEGVRPAPKPWVVREPRPEQQLGILGTGLSVTFSKPSASLRFFIVLVALLL